MLPTRQSRFAARALVLSAAALLGACAAQKPAGDASPAPAVADSAGVQDIDSILAATTAQLATARGEQLDLYAPASIGRAADALASAQKLRARGRPDTEVMLQVNSAAAALKAAAGNKALAQDVLREAIAARAVLEELGSAQRLPRDFLKSTDQFRDLMETLESGNTARARKDQQKLLAQMLALEIATLKSIHLATAEATLERAEAADADDLAPETFKAAENVIAAANRIIETSPKDRAGIKVTGESALAAANKAYFVAQEAKSILRLDEKRAEQRVLHYFSLLERINEVAGVADLSAMSMEAQATALAAQFAEVQGARGIERVSRAVGTPTENPVPAAAPAAGDAAATASTGETAAATPTATTDPVGTVPAAPAISPAAATATGPALPATPPEQPVAN